MLPPQKQHRPVIEQRDQVGKHGGDGRAPGLLSGGQKAEHQQRIQTDVQNAAQRDAEAGLQRPALRPQQVGEERVQRRGCAAQHDRINQRILC